LRDAVGDRAHLAESCGSRVRALRPPRRRPEGGDQDHRDDRTQCSPPPASERVREAPSGASGRSQGRQPPEGGPSLTHRPPAPRPPPSAPPPQPPAGGGGWGRPSSFRGRPPLAPSGRPLRGLLTASHTPFQKVFARRTR